MINRNKTKRLCTIFYWEKFNPTKKEFLIVVDIEEIIIRKGIEYIKNPLNVFILLKVHTISLIIIIKFRFGILNV